MKTKKSTKTKRKPTAKPKKAKKRIESCHPVELTEADLTEIGGEAINSLREAIEAELKRRTVIPWTSSYCNHTETGVVIRFNNSGGRDWLNKEDEKALVKEGFRLDHYDYGRLSAAFLPNANMRQALEAFRRATKYTGSELGCNCCGVPFSFEAYVNGKEEDSYAPSAPRYGNDYEG
jgi:hypothetical protein